MCVVHLYSTVRCIVTQYSLYFKHVIVRVWHLMDGMEYASVGWYFPILIPNISSMLPQIFHISLMLSTKCMSGVMCRGFSNLRTAPSNCYNGATPKMHQAFVASEEFEKKSRILYYDFHFFCHQFESLNRAGLFIPNFCFRLHHFWIRTTSQASRAPTPVNP